MDIKRVKMDCREAGQGCSLTIAGTEEEVRKAGRRHAVEDHGYKDDEELTMKFSSMLKPEEEFEGGEKKSEPKGFERGASA